MVSTPAAPWLGPKRKEERSGKSQGEVSRRVDDLGPGNNLKQGTEGGGGAVSGEKPARMSRRYGSRRQSRWPKTACSTAGVIVPPLWVRSNTWKPSAVMADAPITAPAIGLTLQVGIAGILRRPQVQGAGQIAQRGAAGRGGGDGKVDGRTGLDIDHRGGAVPALDFRSRPRASPPRPCPRR